jgi:hypothetical protein
MIMTRRGKVNIWLAALDKCDFTKSLGSMKRIIIYSALLAFVVILALAQLNGRDISGFYYMRMSLGAHLRIDSEVKSFTFEKYHYSGNLIQKLNGTIRPFSKTLFLFEYNDPIPERQFLVMPQGDNIEIINFLKEYDQFSSITAVPVTDLSHLRR